MNRKVALLAAGATLVVVSAAGVGYVSLATDRCWTTGCRAERAQREEAAFAAATTRTRAAWTDVGNLVEQQVDIGTAITTSAHEQLAASDARTNEQLDRINFVTSGINLLSDIARPYVDEAAGLARARSDRQAGFAASTDPIIRAIGTARLAVRKTVPPTTPTAVEDFIGSVSELRRGSLASLAPLHDQGLITAARASELDHSVRANANALRLAVAAYDQDAKELAVLDHNRATHARDLPIGLGLAQEKQLASVRRDPATAFADRPLPLAQPVRHSPRDVPEQHTRLSMSADIERMNAASRALGVEADRILGEGRTAQPSSHQQPAAQPVPVDNTI